MECEPWEKSFSVTNADGSAGIALAQIGRKDFRLGSTIRYTGAKTGLEGKLSPTVLDDIRQVTPAQLSVTDLASVPGPLRWFLNTYGVHTPAALVHDRLIGLDPPLPGMQDAYADRFFRFMLDDLGVPWMRRWMMWAAVAMRTRWDGSAIKRASLVVWLIAAIAGIVTLAIGAITGNWALVAASLVAPLVVCNLWGKQRGAGLVAAAAAPWLLPPLVLNVVGYGVYLAIEWVARRFRKRPEDEREPLRVGAD